MRAARSRNGVALATFFLGMGIGCDESLPPYKPVQNFTEASIGRQILPSGALDTVSTAYFVHQCANYCGTQLEVALKNIYEETLDGQRLVRVWVELDAVNTPFAFHRQFYTEITEPANINLALDPEETYEVVFGWDRRDDDGVLLDDLVDSTYFAVPEIALQGETPPMIFRLRGNIQIWRNVPPRATNEFMLKLIDFTDRCNVGCN